MARAPRPVSTRRYRRKALYTLCEPRRPSRNEALPGTANECRPYRKSDIRREVIRRAEAVVTPFLRRSGAGTRRLRSGPPFVSGRRSRICRFSLKTPPDHREIRGATVRYSLSRQYRAGDGRKRAYLARWFVPTQARTHHAMRSASEVSGERRYDYSSSFVLKHVIAGGEQVRVMSLTVVLPFER